MAKSHIFVSIRRPDCSNVQTDAHLCIWRVVQKPLHVNEPIHSRTPSRNANLTCWNLVKHLNFMFRLKMGLHTNPAFKIQDETDRIRFKYLVISIKHYGVRGLKLEKEGK